MIRRHRRAIVIAVTTSLGTAAVILALFIAGMSTGYGWGYDRAMGQFDLWAGTDNTYCYVNFTKHDFGCEHAR